MNELSDRFMNKGEKSYAKMVDSVAIGTGLKRVQIELYIKSTRIQTVRVYWNDRKDSTDILIDNQSGVFKYTIGDLSEKNYIFQFVSFDKFGNRSLVYENSVKVYGETYLSSLRNRTVKARANISKNKILEWGPADITNGAKFTEIRYTNQEGTISTVKALTEDQETIIEDHKLGTTFQYRTAFIPSLPAIDTFYTDYQEYTGYFILEKEGWSILSFSSQHDNGVNKVLNVIDGSDNSRWHSLYGGSDYPHWVVIDFGGEASIAQLGVWGSTFNLTPPEIIDARLPTNIQFFVSTDNVVWTDLGIFDCDNTKLGEQLFPVTLTRARYYKFVGLRTANLAERDMVVGELDVYVQ
jgi:hypothetical protein